MGQSYLRKIKSLFMSQKDVNEPKKENHNEEEVADKYAYFRSNTKSPLQNALQMLYDLEKGHIPIKADIKRVRDELVEAENVFLPPIYYDKNSFAHTFRTSIDYTHSGQKRASREGKDVSVVMLKYISDIENDMIDTWDFDVYTFSRITKDRPLSSLSLYLFQKEGLISYFKLDAGKLYNFLMHIERGYADVPFHNVRHATCVLQAMHMLLKYSEIEIDASIHMACYIAAMVHDFEHSGLSNSFLIEVEDELATLYNDSSPLENHHISSSFQVLKKEECNFLNNLSRSTFDKIRFLVVEMVLATDMNHHFEVLSKFRSAFDYSSSSLSKDSSASQLLGLRQKTSYCESDEDLYDNDIYHFYVRKKEIDNKLLYSLELMLKCADLCHFWNKEDIYHDFVFRLEEEFFRQGDLEKSMGRSVSPYFDRNLQGISSKQDEFISIFTLPLVQSLVKIYPKLHCVLEKCRKKAAVKQE